MAAIFRPSKKERKICDSVYSIVSSSEVTPGSLDIWLDLPEEIRHDPSLAPFKRVYEQRQGNFERVLKNETELGDEKGGETENDRLNAVEEEYELENCGNGISESRHKADKIKKSRKAKHIQNAIRFSKLVALVGCWILLTVGLILNREKTDVLLHTAVSNGEIKEYDLQKEGFSQYSVQVSLTGPFKNSRRNDSNNSFVQIWLHRVIRTESSVLQQNSTPWVLFLPSTEFLDFAPSVSLTKVLKLDNGKRLKMTPKDNVTFEESWSENSNDTTVTLRIITTSNKTVPLTVSLHPSPVDETDGIIYAAILLCFLYLLIIFELVNRTIAALLASTLAVAVLAFCGIRPTLPELVSWLDVETLLLLLSMMLLLALLADTGLFDALAVFAFESKLASTLAVSVLAFCGIRPTLPELVSWLDVETLLLLLRMMLILALLADTGIFDALAVFAFESKLASTLAVSVLAFCGIRPTLPELVSWLDVETLLLLLSLMLILALLADTGIFDALAVFAFEMAGGQTWPLITSLCLFTAISSTFLDNVTTVLLVTPITIRLCEVMNLNPVPVLMSMVVFSNVGGAATPVGDPPNVIIASHSSLLNEGINFTTFTLHMGAGILLVGIQTYLQLRAMFRDISKLRHSVPGYVLEMRQEIAAWKRAAGSLTSYSKDEDIVKSALEKKISKLEVALKKRESGGSVSRKDPKFCSTLAEMKQKYRIRDKELLVKSMICLTFVVAVFFLHAIPELQSLSLGWTALLGALLLLLLAEREDLEPILARVEWSTLLFFAALFVFMEALSKLGLIAWIGSIVESLILRVHEESRLAVAIMLVLWVSGLASAFVDNIPLTTMMIRVTAALADPSGLGLPLAPLAWALSFGACLGGNGTLIGASANVVCAGVAEQHGYKFTFMQYLKIGFPIMLGNLIVASVYLLICHCVFQWH